MTLTDRRLLQTEPLLTLKHNKSEVKDTCTLIKDWNNSFSLLTSLQTQANLPDKYKSLETHPAIVYLDIWAIKSSSLSQSQQTDNKRVQ